MNSLERITKGIKLDIKGWEKKLREEGYSEEDVRNFLLNLSPETVESIKNDPEKMAEIIEKLIQESEYNEIDQNYISDSKEIEDENEGLKSFRERFANKKNLDL